jgi:hypothetical protein
VAVGGRQRSQRQCGFATDPQTFPTGGQNAQIRTDPKQFLDCYRDVGNQLFAVDEHEKRALWRQEFGQIVERGRGDLGCE